ncbi:MAG: ABC transporter permease [Polyangiales bacterium]
MTRSRARLTAFVCAASIVAITAAFSWVLGSEVWFNALLENKSRYVAAISAVCVAQLVACVASLAALSSFLQAPRSTHGRARVIWLSGSTLAFTAFTAVSMSVLALAAHLGSPNILGGSIDSLLFALVNFSDLDIDVSHAPTIFYAAETGMTVGALVAVASIVGCFFLIAERTRRVGWHVFDALLLVAFVWCTLNYPLSDITAGADLVGASARLIISAILCVRITLRAIGPILRYLERFGFNLFVAARHLASKKTRFLAANALLSILAVSVASGMLVTVLSVMGGFRDDLKQKILGNHAHIIVEPTSDELLTNYPHVVDNIKKVDGVRAATPFVQGEVMLSSVANRAAAILKGIDAKSVADVTDVVHNIEKGSLAALDPAPSTTDDPDDDTAARTELDGVILGKELAKNLRVLVGDEITIISPRGELGPTGPIPKARTFRVAAIVFSGMYEYDMRSRT